MKGRRDAGHESESEPHATHFSLDRPAVRHRAGPSARRTVAPRADLPQRARAPADLLHLLPSTAASLSPAGANRGDVNSSSSAATARLPAPAITATNIDGVIAATSSEANSSAGGPDLAPAEEPTVDFSIVERHGSSSSLRRNRRLTYHDLMRWIQKEVGRRAAGKARRRAGRVAAAAKEGEPATEHLAATGGDDDEDRTARGGSADGASPSRRGSDASDSDGSAALDALREILERQAAAVRGRRSSLSLKSLRKRRRHSTAASSDTDLYDSDTFVPSCDAVLDNSQTLPLGAVREPDERPDMARTASGRERAAWRAFKHEVVRLAHTFRLRGWRRVPLERSDAVAVARLSGALTNAVYVVAPPADLPAADGRPRPQKLLLRIYGSQVEHLIDRENELQILRRLARKRIGPRLLGTFTNGRFEEFLETRALRAEELRVPDVSRQIAKRMRELHDGIELTAAEVAAGPFVWRNIDRWLPRAEMIVERIESAGSAHVVGSSFALFKEALQKYRAWLSSLYEDEEGIRERLIFAHNDVRLAMLVRLS
jgi:choline kinase